MTSSRSCVPAKRWHNFASDCILCQHTLSIACPTSAAYSHPHLLFLLLLLPNSVGQARATHESASEANFAYTHLPGGSSLTSGGGGGHVSVKRKRKRKRSREHLSRCTWVTRRAVSRYATFSLCIYYTHTHIYLCIHIGVTVCVRACRLAAPVSNDALGLPSTHARLLSQYRPPLPLRRSRSWCYSAATAAKREE